MNKAVMQRGFTLIELLIVVVILGIITTIAVQSFSGATKDGERARIISEMKALNDAIGRFYQGNYSYEGAAGAGGVPVAAVRGEIEASKYYSVTITHPVVGGVTDYQSYYLVAKPLSTGIMVGEGAYSIDQAGQHCYYPGNDNANPAVDACAKTW